MIPQIPKVINDFNALFSLVCARHTGPVRVDFGRQKFWDGIIAGECARNIQFLQADGINAFLDRKTNKLVFSQGTAEILEAMLVQRLSKARETRGTA